MCVVEFVAALKRGEEAMVEWELLCCDGVRPGVGEWNVAFQNNSSSCRWLKTCKKFWLLTREFEFEFEFFFSFLSLFRSSWSGLSFRLFEFRSSLAASEGGDFFPLSWRIDWLKNQCNMAVSREPEDVIISRGGSVLGKKTILKSDHFPGCQNKRLLPHVEGAPNYRQVDTN